MNQEEFKIMAMKTANEYLTQWEKERQEAFEALTKDNFKDINEIKSLFETATLLSDIVNGLFKVNHHLAAHLIAVLTAAVLGVTKGNVIGEVTLLCESVSGKSPVVADGKLH